MRSSQRPHLRPPPPSLRRGLNAERAWASKCRKKQQQLQNHMCDGGGLSTRTCFAGSFSAHPRGFRWLKWRDPESCLIVASGTLKVAPGTEFQPERDKFLLLRANCLPGRARLGENWSKVGHPWSKFGQFCKFGLGSSSFGMRSANSGRFGSTLGRVRPEARARRMLGNVGQYVPHGIWAESRLPSIV